MRHAFLQVAVAVLVILAAANLAVQWERYSESQEQFPPLPGPVRIYDGQWHHVQFEGGPQMMCSNLPDGPYWPARHDKEGNQRCYAEDRPTGIGQSLILMWEKCTENSTSTNCPSEASASTERKP